MRDWLKGILGNNLAIPEGIPGAWVDSLRKMLADAHVIEATELAGRNLDAAVAYILAGNTGTWAHPNLPKNTSGYYGYNYREKIQVPGFFEPLADIPADVLLRWAQVLEAMALVNAHTPFHIPFPGNVHWPELILVYGAGGSLNSWPRPTNQRISCVVIERMLAASGIEPSALIVGSFSTPIDSGYGTAQSLVAVTQCPDYPAALARHVEALRPHLLSGSAGQRAHMLGMLARAQPQTLDALASELAELSLASAKQVRIAADALLRSASDAVIAPLREFALKGKPEQRMYALRHLYDRGVRANDAALREFARTTAAADKAASVQVLPAEWESIQTAETAPQITYDIATPVIDWNQPVTPELSARLDALLTKMNATIVSTNTRTREHYEGWIAAGNKGHYKPQYETEISAGTIKDLKQFLANGKSAAGAKPNKIMNRIWAVIGSIQEFANDAPLHPTQLFKFMWFLDLLHDHRQALNGNAIQAFNKRYSRDGGPVLLEIAQMLTDSHLSSEVLLRSYCAGFGGGLARNWRNEDVWPFIARHVQVVEDYLLGAKPGDYWFDRSMLYQAIGTLPVPPPRLVNALYTVALGTSKSERLLAQQALANLPDKEARILSALSDGKSETRMVAAQWLGRLRHVPAIPVLAKSVMTEKHDTAKGAMLDTLQVLGEPVDKYLKRDSLLPEAKKQLAKGVPKDLDWLPLDSLPEVRWADNGEQVAPEVLRWMLSQACRAKSAEPNAVLRKYCAMFEPRDRERFGQWALEHWLREDVAPISAEEAMSQAKGHAHSTFSSMQTHAQYWKDNPLFGKSEAELVAIFLPQMLRQPRGSAIGSKGVLAVAAACAAERAAAPVQRYIKEWYGTRASQGKALVAMLAWIEHPSATQVMLAIGNRFRTKSIQEEATRQAEALADRKGWTLAELADRTMPSAGFDEAGELELSYGTRAFTAKLLPDFKIELLNPEGKKIAALSEPRQDDDPERAKESKKALSAAKKELKSIVELQTDRLYEALCTGREWSFEDWSNYLNRHPVVRHLTQRLIWLRHEDGKTVAAFRPLDDGTLSNVDDEAVTLPPEARIRVAHDSLMDPEQAKRWQQHLLDYEIAPLFQQLGKGGFVLPAEQKDATSITAFRGHMLDAFALRGRTTKLGYTRGAAEDGGWFHVYEKRFPTLGLAALVEFTGNSLPEENRKVALTQLSFSSSGSMNSWERSLIPLNRIPGVLLSECYDDMRLMAADGTGFDPEWEKKGGY